MELKGQPDLIIGNYSDGNLVASLMAHKQGITQVFPLAIVHLYLLQMKSELIFSLKIII